MAFVNNFMKTLTMPIGELAKWLEENHNVPMNLTIEKWNDITGMNVSVDESGFNCSDVIDQTIVIGKGEKATKKKQKRVVPPPPSTLDPSLCQHIFMAGQRRNTQCNIKPKNGNTKCSSHNKEKKVKDDNKSDQEKPQKQAVVKAKKNEKKYISSSSESSDSEEEMETQIPLTQISRKKIPSDSELDSDTSAKK